MAQGLNYERRKRLVTTFSKPAPKGISYNRFAPQNVKTKDDVTPAIARFIGSIIKDTAISAGQVANEGLSNPYVSPVGSLLGKNFLAEQADRVNPSVGGSMRGEVTPMDFVNIAAAAPIPIGGAVRGGLLAARAGTKFLPQGLKGIKALDASTGITKRAGSMQAGPIASTIERGIGSAFVEATPDAIFSSPAAIDVAKSDLPLGQKAALIGGIVGLVAAPGTAASVFQRSKLKTSKGNLAAGKGNLTDEVRVAVSDTPWSASDRALSSETSMPAPAIAAATQGAREGAGTKWDMSLYENDPDFKKIIDDAVSGKTTAKESQTNFVNWKNERQDRGLKNPNIVGQTWEQLELNARTGSLSRGGNSGPNASPNPPNKAQRFRETLEGNADMIVFDSREKKLYDALVSRGEITPGKQKTNARGKDVRDFQLERKELNEWFKNTFNITDPQRLQAMRERMYQALENMI
jgi:hypothetical protein